MAKGPQEGNIKDFHSMPGYLVRRTQQISTALFAEECADYDLTAVQYAALVAIGLHPQIEAARISRLISLDRSTLGDVLERIEGKGLVRRTASSADRRVKLLSLSTEGKKLIADVESAVLRVQERLLEPLNAKERKTFVSLLSKLANGHKGLPPAKS
ncbi:MAG: MarR family winged helix-turn-helix transcriptional regulator [Bryobacteraceae bacterium]